MWVKNTGSWHIMHSYRVDSRGWPFILTVDGQIFPAGSPNLKLSENPKARYTCSNCNRVDYHIKNTVEVDNADILSRHL